jgi:opacity protein-like surface antigen
MFRALPLLTALMLTPLGSRAIAGPNDWATGSVGTLFGVTRSHQLDNSDANQFVSELQVRGRFWQVLGLELAYNPAAHAGVTGDLVFSSQFRIAGQIFFLPLDFMSMYVSVGVGSNNFGELFSIAADSNSYHGGLGAEFYVWDNLAVGAEWLMVVPGVRSIQRTVVSHALAEAFPGADQPTSNIDVQSLDAWDFVHPRNFQLTFGARYYF